MNDLLRFLQSLSFEINIGCPLAKLHEGICPIGDRGRYDHVRAPSRRITIEDVRDCAKAAYGELGFRGWIQWHYYNDPGLMLREIAAAIPGLREAVPGIRIGLYTSGVMFGREPADLEPLRLFDGVWLRDYTGHRDWVKELVDFPNVRVDTAPVLDKRMSTPPADEPMPTRCRRCWDELCIDHFGYGHVCTGDWRRRVDIGNLWDGRGFVEICERFNTVRDLICQEPMPPEAPEFCRRCRLSMREGDCIIDQEIFEQVKVKRGF